MSDSPALVPLAWFPGFVWLIAVGVALPSSIEPSAAAGSQTGSVR